jgi:small subunit ribosomal protein S19
MATNIRVSQKEKNFRGKKIDELKEMNLKDFSKLLKSRQRRALVRNFEFIQDFVKKCKLRKEKGKAIKTHKRELIITPELVGMTIGIYNGKDFTQIDINEDMIGHRLGEFSMTRKIAKHTSVGTGASKSSVTETKK